MFRCSVDVSDISCLVRHCPALEHVLQHGVVGRRQHPRSLQPLQAQQQRAKQNVGAAIEWVHVEQCCMAQAGPAPAAVLRLKSGLK